MYVIDCGAGAGETLPSALGVAPFLLRLTAGGRGVRGATRGMRACIYATAGGCGFATAVGAAVRSRLTGRGRALREIARPRVIFMAGLPLLARGSVVLCYGEYGGSFSLFL